MASIESIFMYLVAYLPKNQYISSKKTNKTTSLSFGLADVSFFLACVVMGDYSV